MACFTKTRQKVKAEVYAASNPPVYSSIEPSDLVIWYYTSLAMAGLNIIQRDCRLSLVDYAVCGAPAGVYVACEKSVIGASVLEMEFYRPYWVKLSDDSKKALVAHELSHALLRMPHRTGPSIMQESLIDGHYFAANEDALFKQLVSDFLAGGSRV